MAITFHTKSQHINVYARDTQKRNHLTEKAKHRQSKRVTIMHKYETLRSDGCYIYKILNKLSHVVKFED